MPGASRSKMDKRLRQLISEMESIFGPGDPQGEETIFHCPLCENEEDRDGRRKHLRISGSINDRDYPYIGCRIHNEPDDWIAIRRSLVESGVSESLLSPSAGAGSSSRVRAPIPSGPGLGDEEPIPYIVVERAHKLLVSHAKADKFRDFLTDKRGITMESIVRFELGVNSNNYGSSRITIPIRNKDGKIANIRGYLPFPKTPKDIKVIPWPHPTLADNNGKSMTYGKPCRIWGLETIQENERIVFCAGEFDRIILEQNGIRAVTGTGAEGTIPRAEDCEELRVCSEVVIIYDCDKAGRTGSDKLARSLMEFGLTKIKVIDLDPGKKDGYDISDFFLSGNGNEELEKLIDDADYLKPPKRLPELSERRMAEMIASEWSGQIRYVADSETWARWDNHRWATGLKREISSPSNIVVDTARELYDDARMRESFDEAKFFRKFLETGKVKNIVTQMGWLEDLRTEWNQYDSHRHLINVANGMLDLETGRIHEPDPTKMLSKITKGAYIPGEKHPIWTEFLRRFIPDREMQRYIQRLMGYSLEDGNPHRMFIVMKGATSTGKSAFSEAVMASLGGYAGSFNLSLFRDKQDESPRADIVSMMRQRMSFASETSAEWHLHADAIKRMTGADTIKARALYSNTYIEAIPSFTPIIRTNAAPTIKAADLAIFRRLRVIPFEVQISEDEVDPNYVSRMIEMASDAILSWVIDGYRDYVEEGFGDIPLECLEAELEFRDDVSILNQFLKEHCRLGSEYKTTAEDLFSAYLMWSASGGFHNRDLMNKIEFGRKLSGLGFPTKSSGGIRYRHGIELVGAEKVI